MTEGKAFSFPYTGGKIVGFHGSCKGSHLESIGAFYKPIPHTYPVKIFGPFGSQDEKSLGFGDIKGIDVCYSDFIKSITFKVDEATSSDPETNYGNGGENTFKVRLRNGEHVTSLAGYFQNANDRGTLISSLTFQTNERILGPIGREEGASEYFSLPSEAGKVTRFFGRSDGYLKSIGAQVEPYYPFESVGLFGLESGSKWDHGNQHNNVSRIIVQLDSSGERFIRSIKFEYINKNNRLPQVKTDGVTDGNESPGASPQEIKLDPDEYLTSISGYMLQSQTCGFTSLTFQTNKKTLKTIGVEKGKHFSSPATGGKIVGFYGWSGEHLNAIGARFQPISHLYPVKSIGPFGGTSGNDWDDGKFDGVKEIWVMHNPDIHYIKFLYVKFGEKDLWRVHGCLTNRAIAKLEKFSLDYPREYLTSIFGYKQEDGAIIQSLTFYTNRRKLGPFGEEEGKYFWYPSTGSRIIGFYGRCGKKLNAIGVYAEPVPQWYPFETIGPFGGFDGTPWDDGVHTDVMGFRISFDDTIHSIGIVYDNNGSFVDRSTHGGGDGPRCMELWLDYPKERLLSISVWGKESEGTYQIHNLKIFTTKNTHGPFIPRSWSNQDDWNRLTNVLSKMEKFTIPSALDGGRIVGFFGRAGPHLISIGARLESY
ncbi:jacalin-related lectin 16-like [Rhodamnia argentea]|uniref:Jacalin-related lectin 16-like n=1 Tax=Rhodamnia argentea TaxID=178133 RepID=A0ABM3GXF9_9MYRT|nr:jacalin-related lectin 16-like [Rhodamnia argentea]